MPPFKIISDLKLTGDQPQAVDKLVEGLAKGHRKQTLMGVTGSGKTFTMANIIERTQRPTLVLCHNKTLAAQLCSEFRDYFPENAAEYFVSYYDYYQPEAYMPRTDTYIDKEIDVNEEIDKLRHAATRAILTRNDVIIVASVSCIYNLGSPEEYRAFVTLLNKGQQIKRDKLVRQLIDMHYERNDMDFTRGRFRVRGDTVEVQPSYEVLAVRIEFYGDEIERIIELDPVTGEILAERTELAIYPAKHFLASQNKLNSALGNIEAEMNERIAEFKEQDKLIEAQRIEYRTNYDLEMLREVGYCHAVENYSRHLSGRPAGSPPDTLLDYFPDNFLMFIDESHMTIPQVRGMFGGDKARKDTLVEFGFRLPSALDNRPLNFNEFDDHIKQVIYTSATPRPYEYENSAQVVEQVIRPTGLLDPTIEVKPTKGQIDDLIDEIQNRVKKEERCLVTTLTKRMAEQLADYIKEMGIKTHYLHSEIDTLERVEILRDLRLGVYDVVVGINLLREGLDLPEVSLVAILDADKEGYLRSTGALIQTMGRAARHEDGHVIMYADSITGSMHNAIDETNRRRMIQMDHNEKHGITPTSIKKAIRGITDQLFKNKATEPEIVSPFMEIPKDEIMRMIKDLESQMKTAARNLEFEKAALLRDNVLDLRKILATTKDEMIAGAGTKTVPKKSGHRKRR
ncbi:excinuclease ABC subunit UvrB [Chloroflexota bacterium]